MRITYERVSEKNDIKVMLLPDELVANLFKLPSVPFKVSPVAND